MIQAFTKTLGLARIHKKCGLVMGRNSLDAELGGCGMLIESSSQWVDKNAGMSSVAILAQELSRSK